MPDLISYAKEIYKKPPKNVTSDKNVIVPIRGIYVTGVYKPPLYMETGVHIVAIDSTPATIKDYTTAYADDYDPTTSGFHVLDVFVDPTPYNIEAYRSAVAPNQVDTTASGLHLYDININANVNIDWYSRSYTDQTDGGRQNAMSSGICLYDIDIFYIGHRVDTCLIIDGGMSPEPCIRLTEISTKYDLTVVN